MARINRAVPPKFTHEGAKAPHISPIQELQRTVLACLLWEDTFYESGEDAAARIAKLVPLCTPKQVGDLAVKARSEFRLRHVPLLLAVVMAGNRFPNTAATINNVIQRADELAEFVALYWALNHKRANGKNAALSAQVKKGLAAAFQKFDAYHLAKYNRDHAVKLRDVLFLCHAKPKDDKQDGVWKRLIDGTLESPDTWEVALSAGKDKKETWERLMKAGELGYLALIRNLRNMQEAGVDTDLVKKSLIEGAPKSKALPFRFITAVRHAPQFAPELEQAMFTSMRDAEKLRGRTVVCVDVSGSMDGQLSAKSEMTRAEAAAALAILVREVCPQSRIIGFGTKAAEIPALRGFAISEMLRNLKVGKSTNIDIPIHMANQMGYDRLIVITDEQAQTKLPDPLPGTSAYVMNVATYKNGLGYGIWTHIDGFSEGVVRYVMECDKNPSKELDD